MEEIAGRRCLVSPRYDRVAGEGPDVKRVHCETFCQALGIPPGAVVVGEDGKESYPPGWAEARGLLNAVSRADEVVNLLTASFCNYILGNGDAHGQNFALIDREKTSLSGPERKWRLAPCTDLTSTVVYDDPIHRGLVISEEYQETSYLLELAEVCERCELTSKSCAGWRRPRRRGSAWRWRRSRRGPRRKAGTSRSSTRSSNSPLSGRSVWAPR